MRKLTIIAASIAALASLTVAATASADVARTQAPAQPTTATFTVTQPAGAVGQWDNVWTHNYTVTVNDDGTFAGTGHQSGQDQNGPYEADETITGQFGVDNVSFVATRDDGLVTTLENAPFGGAVTIATLNVVVPWTIEMKVTQPVITVGTTTYKNHGDYVTQMGGGTEAAHSPIGKPIQASSK